MAQAAQPQYSDFDAELEQVKRARANIDLLRKNRMAQPEGAMVGKQYVPPHWTQSILAPMAEEVGLGMREGMAGVKEARLNKAMQAQAEQWTGARPQPTQVEQAGPVEPGQGPLMSAPIEPSQQDRLAWAQQGAKNPLTRALAAKYGEDVLIKEPERDEARAWRASEAEKTRQLTRDTKEQQLEFERKRLEENMQRYKDDRIAQGQWKSAHDGVLVQLENIKKDRAIEAAERKATAAGKAKTDKPVPNTIAKPIRAAEEAKDGLIAVHSTFDDKFAGLGGYADKVSGTWNPFSGKDADASAQWWSNYENQAALVQRHEKFGTALSQSERDLWAAATIKPGMKAERIRANLKTRRELAETFYKKIRQQSIDLGYPQVAKAFHDPDEGLVAPGDPLGLPSTPVSQAPGAPVVPQAPVVEPTTSQTPGAVTANAVGPRVTAPLAQNDVDRAQILMSEYHKPPQPGPQGEDPAIQAGRYATDKASLKRELASIGVDADTGGPLQRRASDKAPVANKPRKKFNAATGMLE